MTQALGEIKICYMDTAFAGLTSLPVEKACIVTNFLMSVSGAAGRMKKIIETAGIACTLFDGVTPVVDPGTIKRGILCMDPGTDLIVALGSGAVIDAAKAMLFFRHKALGSMPKPFFAVIPSFCGTGSEITAITHVTVPQKKVTIPLMDELMIPDMIMLDARLTRTIPAPVIASTGMAVLARSIDAYVSTGSNGTAEQSLETAIVYVFKYLARAFACSQDTVARQRMLMAACLSGMAIGNSGLGLATSLSCALGKKFDISRGNAQALVLAPVIYFNRGQAAKKYSVLSRRLGLPGTTDEQGAQSLVYAIEWLVKKIHAPSAIRDLGIDKIPYAAAVESMAQDALADPITVQNPRHPLRADLERLLAQIY